MEKGDKGSVEVSNLVRARLGSGQYTSRRASIGRAFRACAV